MLKKFLSLFLAIIILISFVPIVGEGVGFVKDLDVIFGNFRLNVNNRKIINHKEPFLYDGNFYVPLSDLAKGLEIGISINNNNVYLNSNNKLNVDSYDSKLPLVFQRGYEVLAKERLIEELEDEVRALEGKSNSKINYKINATMRSIRVGFGNISIYLDGKKLNLEEEPLKYNNDIYVSLDSIAPYLYITPELSKDKTTINIDTNGILSPSTSSSISSLLGARNGRNYLLDLQRAELEKRKSVLVDLRIPYEKISSWKSLERYLNSHFNKINDLDVNIKVTKQSNWINLDIGFTASKNHLWTKLSRLDVEDWIWNIYTAIVNLYNEDTLVSGSIVNPFYSQYSSSKYKNYVTFYSKDNDIYFDFTNSRLATDSIVNPNHLLEVLNNNLNRYMNFYFKYDASKSGDNLELKIYPTTDSLSKSSIYSKMGYLRSLNQRIRTIYPSIDVYGQIIYPGDIDPLDFYISENKIRSKALLDESIEYVNNGFGYFYTGVFGYRLKYSIYEVDLMNFHLVAEGDFSVEDDGWIYGGETAYESLYSTVHYAVSTIASLWDANLTVDIVDKNGVGISEYSLNQESVALITANPSGGKVPEGEKVYLYTATPGATIYYTTDGSNPTEASLVYDGKGISITRDMTIKAIGYKEGLNPSPVSTFNYIVEETGEVSEGLTNLILGEGSLSPAFSQNILEYTANVDNSLSSIYVTPYAANGTIKINGEIVISGVSRLVDLNNNSTIITIEVKEDNKLEKVYKVIINKTPSDNTYTIENLVFNTSFEIFSGKLTNPNVTDFSSYEVRLLTQSNVIKTSTKLDKDGNFSLTNLGLDWFDKLFGMKFEILDSTGKVVFSGNLN